MTRIVSFLLAALYASAAPAFPQSAPVAVTGVVQDQTGSILPAATVDLVTASGAVVWTTITDGAGAFRFERVAPGQYELRARYEGFESATAKVRVGNRPPSSQRLVLGLAGLKQEITVSNAAADAGASAANNVDAITIDQNMLEELPVFDNDFVATMSQFLDAGSIGNGGVTIVVNGMEVSALFNGQMQYTLSRGNNDTNGINAFPANDDDLTGEWARADFDRRHRFNLLGRTTAIKLFDLGVGLAMNSGGPYNETLGLDLYNNGRGRARRVGVPRNSLTTTGFASLDIRASRDIKLGAGKETREVTFGFDAFNMLNTINYGSFVGTLSSPLYGQPVSARSPRQLQFSARMKF